MPLTQDEFSEEYIAGSGQTQGTPPETPSVQITELLGKVWTGEPYYGDEKPHRVVVRAQIIHD